MVREGGYEVDWSSDAGGQAVGFCRKVNGVFQFMWRMAKCGRNVVPKGIWRCIQNLWLIFSAILD